MHSYQVHNSPIDVCTGQSKAMRVCFPTVSSLHTLPPISMALSAPLACRSIYIAGKALELLKCNSYLFSSCLPPFFPLKLYPHCLLYSFLFLFFSYTCFSKIALPVCFFPSSVALFLFLAFFLYSSSSTLHWFKKHLWSLCAQPYSKIYRRKATQ